MTQGYLDSARQEMAEQEEQIARQQALIARLEKTSAPVDKAVDRLLQMQLLLLDMRGQQANRPQQSARVTH